MSKKSSARSNALEGLHAVIETHRPILEEAFAPNGCMSLLPPAVRNAIAEIMAAARRTGTAPREVEEPAPEAAKENPLLVAEEGRGRID